MPTAREIYGQKWREKEYLIVLQAYFEHKGEPQHADTPFIHELSRILGRTPHSILYRLQNYASIDPEETDLNRKGKSHVADWVRRFFENWSSNRDSLRAAAELCLRDERAQLEPDLFNLNPIRMPTTFRSYELLDEIGRGGFGIVFSCLNVKSNEPCAIKVIDGPKLYDTECLHRFRREIRALRAVRHRHVIRIHDDNLDTESDYPAYVMDLAEYDLPKYLAATSAGMSYGNSPPILEPEEAKVILLSVVAAVQCLHNVGAGIVHRDINPSNILRLFDGTWVLADFSLVKFLPPKPVSTSFVTASRFGLGTSHYTAPEQYVEFRVGDRRSDVHSLGWLIRDLFSREGPYPRRHPSGLPGPLERIFLKATEYEMERRFQDIDEMKAELDVALGPPSITIGGPEPNAG